jgi:hypothetical protein
MWNVNARLHIALPVEIQRTVTALVKLSLAFVLGGGRGGQAFTLPKSTSAGEEATV